MVLTDVLQKIKEIQILKKMSYLQKFYKFAETTP